MSDVSYKDHCIITRRTDEYDEYDQPIGDAEVYNDMCDFQGGAEASLSIISHNDVVYIPKFVAAKENDFICVTDQWGATHEGVLKRPNYLGLDLLGDCVTEIEIKQSMEKE